MLDYFTMNLRDAAKKGYLDADGETLSSWVEEDEYRSGIFRHDYSLLEDAEKPQPRNVRLVGCEANARLYPEDATFNRDYSWVLEELKRLADEHNDAEMEAKVRDEY